MAGDGPESSEDVQIILVGEAPGANEDRRGIPFIGESGQILRTELDRNKLTSKTYITNLVKCRPPKNRNPTAAEIKACRPYLEAEIEKLKPDYVVTAGVPATKTLFRGKAKINQFHGEVIENEKVDYIGMPIFHPAYTMRDPSKLPGLKADLARLARLMKGGLRNTSVEWKVVRRGNLSKFIQEFEQADEFAFDIEASGLFPFNPESYVTAVAIALVETTWVIPGFMHPDYQQFSHSPFAHGNALKQLMQLLFFIARRDKKRSYAQNGKFDNKWLRCHFGGSFRLSFDTMLAHHLIDENVGHDLTSMCRTYLDEPEYDIPLTEKHGKSEKPMRNYKYCGQDAAYTLRLGHLFEEILRDQPDLHRLFWKLVMPGARAMEEAEMEGLTIDPAARKEIGLDLLSRKITLEHDLNDAAGYEVNWDSPQQIAQLLYEELGLPCKILTPKKKKSTSETALLHLIGKHEVVDKLMAYREAAKFFNTYIKGWEQYRIGDKYFFDYKLHGTVTGRYSSPLHPIPRDGSIRNLVTAPPGWTLVPMDIKTAEMRIAAHLSKDPEMMRCFNEGVDVHWRTMIETLAVGTQGEFAGLVRKTAHKLNPAYKKDYSYSVALDMMLSEGPGMCMKMVPRWYEGRTRAKAMNFGYLYGMREPKFIEQAKKDYGWEPSMTEAKSSRNAYFTLYSRLEEWHRKTKKLARLNGYVRCLTGRLRRLPGIHAKDRKVKSEAERQAVNSGVQAMIGDYKAMVLIEVHQTISRDKCRLVGEHHDSVLTIVKDEHIDEVVPKMLRIAERPKLMDTFKINLSVPMEGEAELGPWGKGTHYEVRDKGVRRRPRQAVAASA
jgi:DNA polymerase-1